MEQNLITALIGGLGGMLGWGFADFFAKKTIDQIGDVVTLFWGQLFGLVPLSLLFFFSRSPIPHKIITYWPYVILLGAWTGLSYIPVYVAFKKGKVSLISPIQATYSVLVIVALALLFHQIIPFGTLVDFIIIFIGILFMKIDIHDLKLMFRGKRAKSRKINGLKEIIFANILYAIWIIALDKFINGEYWLPYLFVIHAVSVVSIYGYAIFKKINLKITDNSLWKFLIAIGFSDILAFSAFYYGLSQSTYVSIVVMLSSACSLPTIILAHFALKERITRTQFAAVITVILGVMALSVQR